MTEVVVVDAEGSEVATASKFDAHRPPGMLHRAFSLFVHNPEGQILLQRRALDKYHFAGLWANACCSHPAPGEAVEEAVRRRVVEELGFACDPRPVGVFTYRAEDPISGMVEHERDHVFEATVDVDPDPDPNEIADWRWACPTEFADRLDSDTHAPWLQMAIDRFPHLVRA